MLGTSKCGWKRKIGQQVTNIEKKKKHSLWVQALKKGGE